MKFCLHWLTTQEYSAMHIIPLDNYSYKIEWYIIVRFAMSENKNSFKIYGD